MKGYWNGLETSIELGTAIVADSLDFPEYWARLEGLIGERINVVKVDLSGVNYGGGIIYLDDRANEGLEKVTVGHGGPSYGHRNVTIVSKSFKPRKASDYESNNQHPLF